MKSRTSCFNGTVFKKNMTRFAPVWLLYTLALLLGMTMMYIDGGQDFWFASRMGEMIQYGSLINLVYAPAVAMLLFGDLYNSRMCNALHAMPLKRECWFLTNVLSGLVFHLLPTAIMAGLSIPLLGNTCVVDAWQIALWAFLGMNLSFLCFFGIALFSVFCTGNRQGMLAIYAILNGGAYVVYFLIDSIYTPLLYGVVTPSALAENLTPISNLIEAACVEVESYWSLMNVYAGREAEMKAAWFLLPEGWKTQLVWAAVGLVFGLLGWLLYRRRKLECAGDTMAVRALEPVFQVCISLCAAAFFSVFTGMFFGSYPEQWAQYLFLGSGLLVGWFAGKMLIERTVRVFRLKNWLGLAGLAAVVALSLGLTHYDVLGIETWTPEAEDVRYVTFGYSDYRGMTTLTEEADIAEVIRLQELALEERVEATGSYVILDGERVLAYNLDKETRASGAYVYATTAYIHYGLKNGRVVSREYIIWGDGETGAIVNEYLSRWEVVRDFHITEHVQTVYGGQTAVEEPVQQVAVEGELIPEEYWTDEEIESLLAAIQADCEDRTMTQRETFHTGHMRRMDEDGNTHWFRSFWIEIYTEESSLDVNVYADSANTLKWLADRGLMDFTVYPENGYAG